MSPFETDILFGRARSMLMISALFLSFAVCLGSADQPNANSVIPELDLKDGRVFKDVRVISQTPTSILIRYSGGASSIAKTLLPETLLIRYPIAPEVIKEAKEKELERAKLLDAAKKGDVSAELSLGDIYHDGDGVPKDSEEALKWYQKAAAQGNAIGEFNLAVLYDNGDGVAKDAVEALKWYRKAAENGDSSAQYNLGVMYERGNGVPKNVVEAVGWYRKAAMQGDTNAQVNLGYMYAHGEGVPKDEVEGLAWTYIAAASGDKLSAENEGIYERRIGREMALVAQKRSQELLREIADQTNEPRAPSLKESITPNSPIDEAVKATGSGAIVSADGVVLTAAHVVAGGKRYRIKTAQGIKDAKLLGIDEANDVAILKLDGGSYSPLPVVSSRGVRLGQSVATIGFPETELQGFSPKVTRGEISSLNGFRDDPREWQISVPVQSGNSGGPLLDENGNLIGIVASKLGLEAVRNTGDLLENVNYAVKATYALPLIEPYLPENLSITKAVSAPPRFEDMVAKAQQSVVLILVY